MKHKMQEVRFAILNFVIIWNGGIKNLRNAWRLFLRALSGGPSKSVPLDFGTKKSSFTLCQWKGYGTYK